ncbi:efflux transporter periplasmic adaptor subunit [Acinetobacter sp. ANC 4558]|uniref:efflux RND transporter periplasmic adaptor subunit n=1 Tax=Acinetobacter sp. ANC 4558 TaxID=1977876 RepID=UPI000A330A94|nr:efflux RND transporter periplasmic adaptor subunit [Acinetobacter sp. ANC 4558]OTG86739.1 efflux transporter periplasmic adaptor subunit [Acinetobacter sp. ANC 4558]
MNKKLIVIITSVFVISILSYLTYQFIQKPVAAQSSYPPVKVALTKAILTEQNKKITAVGELEAVKQVQVSSEVAGRVQSIYFRSGQYVHAGQLLVQLNDETEKGELAQLKAKLKLNEMVYKRANELVKINAVSQEEVDHALANRDMTLGQIQQLQARVQQKKVKAPFSGHIGIRQINLGQYLQVGESIVNLVDTQSLFVNFTLDEKLVPNLKIGQVLQTHIDAYPDESFNARVTAIDPLISKSRTVQIQALLDNSKGLLKAGMFANITLQQNVSKQVVEIPETAVTYTAYGESVYIAVKKDNQLIAQRVKVSVGERNQGWVEVSGLQANDLVVTSGQIKLSDSTPIDLVQHDTLAIPPRVQAPEKQEATQ